MASVCSGKPLLGECENGRCNSVIPTAIHLGQCKEEDFEIIHHQWVLKHGKNAAYSSFIMETILEQKMELFYYIQAYYRCFMKGKEYSEYPVYDMERRNDID